MNIHQTARFQVKADQLGECEAASSEAVKRFTDVLYPRLVVPVEFTEYSLFASTQTPD